MAAYKNYGGQQSTGYPALIFWELANWGKNNEGNLALLISLEKLYSHIRAKLPTLYTITDERWEEIQKTNDDLSPSEVVAKASFATLERLSDFETDEGPQEGEISKARKMLHNLKNEDMATITTKHEEYLGILFGIYENLDQICADTKIIDNERMGAAAPPAETS